MWREIGAVVECYADGTYEGEFVAQNGYTYALVTLRADHLLALCEKPRHDAQYMMPALG
ncbi:MAG: DUF4926 domain-containing protein [Candidatus Entotheonellia bacterium]